MTPVEPMAPLFHPGRMLMTPGAVDAMKSAGQKPGDFLWRHCAMDQGELCDSDHRANLSAMKTGLRIFNHYKTSKGDTLWVVTEWVDMKSPGANSKLRELTTILLPEEY